MVAVVAYSLFSVFFLIDIYHDFIESVPLSHIWHEVLLFAIAVSATLWQLFVIFKKNHQLKRVQAELLESKKSYVDWKEKAKLSAGVLRQLIVDQFEVWQLSQSEKDIALLLIKGLSMKEIAEIRQTHEKTVRQQATTVYRKAGLSGRQELAAFFLEDILFSE